MSTTRSEIIKVANSWVGKKESDGSHKSIIDLYNSHKPLARNYKVKYTDSWCATTMGALAVKTGATDIIPMECSVAKMVSIASKNKIWVENDAYVPQTGDMIVYDWDDNGKGDNRGNPDHIGIVKSVNKTKGTLQIIEGNYNDKVAVRNIKVNAKYIRGYITPKYKAEPKKATTTTTPKPATTTTKKVTVDEVAKMVVEGKFGNGNDTRKANIKKAYPYIDYEEVRKAVNKLVGGSSSSSKTTVTKKPATVKKTEYYSKYSGLSFSVDTVFKKIGVPSKYYGSWEKRKPVAKVNGYPNYTGTASQNTSLVKLARKGKLVKP